MKLIEIGDYYINPEFVSDLSIEIEFKTDGTPHVAKTKINMSNGDSYLVDLGIELVKKTLEGV